MATKPSFPKHFLSTLRSLLTSPLTPTQTSIKNPVTSIFIFSLITFFALIYFIISINKHYQFQTFGWDLGIFDQLIYKWSRGLDSYSTVWEIQNFADHFNPILFLLVPFYWIKPHVYWLFAVQALLVTSAAIPIYLTALKYTRHRLFALSLCLSYLMALPLQYAITSEFHEHTLTPFFIAWALYFIDLRQPIGYWISILALLITKEEFTLLAAAIGIFALTKKLYLQGIATFIISLSWFYLLIYHLMPAIGHMDAYYRFDFGQSGYAPQDILLNLIHNPLLLPQSFFDSPLKIRTLIDSFWPFGFLPLFSPAHWILILEQFMTRFLDYNRTLTRWTNFGIAGIPVMAIMPFATITVINFLTRLHQFRPHQRRLLTLISLYLLTAVLTQDLIRHGPINSILKPAFYQYPSWIQDNYHALTHIPPDAKVAAQNSLVPHLSHRPYIYQLPNIYDADYIALDLHDGPNKYSPSNHQHLSELKDDLLQSQTFHLFFNQNNALILRRTFITSFPSTF